MSKKTAIVFSFKPYWVKKWRFNNLTMFKAFLNEKHSSWKYYNCYKDGKYDGRTYNERNL